MLLFPTGVTALTTGNNTTPESPKRLLHSLFLCAFGATGTTRLTGASYCSPSHAHVCYPVCGYLTTWFANSRVLTGEQYATPDAVSVLPPRWRSRSVVSQSTKAAYAYCQHIASLRSSELIPRLIERKSVLDKPRAKSTALRFDRVLTVSLRLGASVTSERKPTGKEAQSCLLLRLQ